jgi:predicted enzyme related to lactoylglutathione lyase
VLDLVVPTTIRAMVLDATFVIAVPDLERSATFYRDVLGFTIAEIGDRGWRMFVRDACTIMAGECRDAMPPRDLGDHAYYAYLGVDDVDAYYRRVRESGTEVVTDLCDQPWGMREFGLRTVDGHRIMVGTRIGPNPGYRLVE